MEHKSNSETTTTAAHMSVRQAADYIGISVRLVRELIASRKIKKIRIGERRIIIRRVDIDAYLESIAN